MEKEIRALMMEALAKHRKYRDEGNAKDAQFCRGKFMAFAEALAIISFVDEGEILNEAVGAKYAV